MFGNSCFSGSCPRGKHQTAAGSLFTRCCTSDTSQTLVRVWLGGALHADLLNGGSSRHAGISAGGLGGCRRLQSWGLPVWLCMFFGFLHEVNQSMCQKHLRPASDPYLSASQCSHSIPPPSLLVRHVFLREILKIRIETDGNDTPSISTACVSTACPYMIYTWRRGPKEEFARYLRAERGWMLDGIARGTI